MMKDCTVEQLSEQCKIERSDSQLSSEDQTETLHFVCSFRKLGSGLISLVISQVENELIVQDHESSCLVNGASRSYRVH